MTARHLAGIAVLALIAGAMLGTGAVAFGRPDKARPNPLEQRISVCDHLPDINRRAPCWRKAYREEKR